LLAENPCFWPNILLTRKINAADVVSALDSLKT
jgi:hypothetical protein